VIDTSASVSFEDNVPCVDRKLAKKFRRCIACSSCAIVLRKKVEKTSFNEAI
jgi:hypothetical protein